MPIAIFFYDVVLAGHILAIVIAFGVVFAYPVLIPYVERNHPRAVPALWGGVGQLGKLVITPFGTLALIFGAYLASDRDYWSEVWVTVPLVILVVVMGVGGAYLAPRERKLAELGERDVAASGHGDVTFSDEFTRTSRATQSVQRLLALLVVVAVFFMAAKPFA